MMFDKRYQVSVTFFTVKNFLNREDAEYCRIRLNIVIYRLTDDITSYTLLMTLTTTDTSSEMHAEGSQNHCRYIISNSPRKLSGVLTLRGPRNVRVENKG